MNRRLPMTARRILFAAIAIQITSCDPPLGNRSNGIVTADIVESIVQIDFSINIELTNVGGDSAFVSDCHTLEQRVDEQWVGVVSASAPCQASYIAIAEGETYLYQAVIRRSTLTAEQVGSGVFRVAFEFGEAGGAPGTQVYSARTKSFGLD
jgi:hypothetical protein